MYFSILNENVITSKAIQKYIKIEVCSQENMNRFKNKIAKFEICSKLNQDLNTDLNYNYNILSKELQASKNLHIPPKIRKFNKREHKKEKWMNNDLLVQVVEKIRNMSYGNLHQSLNLIMNRLSKTLKCTKRIQ